MPRHCCRQILSGFQQPAAPAALASADQAPDEASAFGGFGGLLGTISSLGGGSLLDNVTSSEPTEVDKGNEILGQIFGSKDGSRAVAAQAAAQSGVEPSLLKKMLPILAMAAAGLCHEECRERPSPGPAASFSGSRFDPGLRGGLSGDRPAAVLRPENLPEDSLPLSTWVGSST